MAEQGGKEPIVTNLYDGSGNEVKIVTTANSDGERVQPTGDTAEEAMSHRDKEKLGEGFGGH